ncbi:multidrug transporter subunit MdtN [Phenylobacterium sp.]|uniref:multidrug transporter subunit MdtN n=1 Tax=Phenylobacterium sp. TaxID=1871053 RepID=UPI002E304C94|nr:multidrug transporter subunit MdtN [Phenylobacterium sp.]HEX3364147.1 multidrug transporter subunit MdtN [Phenylobacterium sp.]
MKAAGLKRVVPIARLVTLALVVAAAGLSLYAFSTGEARPSSDDASIDADTVHVAATVGGRIVNIGVVENGRVRRGDLLFQIDPVPYEYAVAQARADLAAVEAQLGTRRRLVSTQRSNTLITSDEARNAATNLALADRTVERLRPLAAEGYVPRQQLDQAETEARDAETRLRQARQQHAAAVTAVDTDQAALAEIEARRAALNLAERHLQDTSVRATHDGLVVGLTAASGEMVAPGQALFTLVDADDWFAVANFRETDLKPVHPGDCVTVYSMLDRRRPIAGVVQGVGWGVLDQDRINLPRSVPYVQRSLDWVRVAQRFPVRVRLRAPPSELVRLGASAVVEIKHGPACR